MKNKYGETITKHFSKILSTSKQKPIKIESDRGAEFYNSIFQNFSKSKNIQHYSRLKDKGSSIAERVIRTIRILLKKPVFLAGNADWISELLSVIKKYHNTIHSSTKMIPVKASKKSNEKLAYSNLQDKRSKLNPNYKLGQLVKTADIKRVFSKGVSTKYGYKFYTVTEVLYNTIPSYRTEFLPEKYNENVLLPTKITLEENNEVMKKLNLTE